MKSSSPKSGTYPRTHVDSSRPKPCVMLAGDDDATEMYVLYLERAGFHVLVANETREAHRIAGAKQEHVDVIVADFAALEDSLALTGEMQADPRTWNIPVLVLTLLPKDAARASARACGASALLSKPCLPQHLATEIRRMLALAHGDAPVVRSSHLRIA